MSETSSAADESEAAVEGGAIDGAQMPVEATDSVSEGDDTGEHPDDVKWRQRYRQAETQLIVERARLSEIARREAERLAAVHLEDPADLWRDGLDVADILGDDGLVDPQLVDSKAHSVIEQHPHWRRAKPVTGAPASAVTSDGKIPSGPTEPTWADLLSGGAAAG